ncbi:hypothetical protein [Hyphomonas johnsonii]|uniref:Lipoprotein n=1 Tax=Hyphomonas johnsonii MHS-2 TaxID=1280950 RepID=A0A059FFX5_9PROT|nr:hypothetical protein [Hyphomonas johnsonii]KCZ89507.1 hypothetical protein HJO_14852 [Hyphomonas johnsonii MHS-2]
MTPRLIPFRVLAFALFLAACATPPPVETGPPFESVMVEAKGEANPYKADAVLTGLLERQTLTDDQRARALYARGSLRRQDGDDRRGAVEDFKAMLALAPAHPLGPNAREELEFAETDVETIEAGLQRMLSLSQWFDSMWVLGAHDEAAARYRKSGISPNPAQLADLAQAGFVCMGDETGDKVYTVGDRRDDLEDAYWCPAD